MMTVGLKTWLCFRIERWKIISWWHKIIIYNTLYSVLHIFESFIYCKNEIQKTISTKNFYFVASSVKTLNLLQCKQMESMLYIDAFKSIHYICITFTHGIPLHLNTDIFLMMPFSPGEYLGMQALISLFFMWNKLVKWAQYWQISVSCPYEIMSQQEDTYDKITFLNLTDRFELIAR